MRGSWRLRVAVGATALAVLVGACSSGGSVAEPEPAPTTTTVPAGSSTSSPFSVAVPVGYELVSAGRGQYRQSWGEDCCGTDEPFTILTRAGGAGSQVRVAISGYEGAEGGFFQTVNGYADHDAVGEQLEVDGKQAAWSEGDPDTSALSRWAWPELAVDEGDDLAVSVSGPGLSRDEAEAVYAAVEVDGGHADAPTVPAPPDGMVVVGSVDADGVIALQVAGEPNAGSAWGPTEGHSAGWTQGSRSLTVQAIPGRATSLEAAALGGLGSTGSSEVRTDDGEPVLVIDNGPDWDSRSITVALRAEWGDLVVVNAFTDQARAKDPVELQTVDELVALARSVEQTDPAGWDAFVATAPG